VQFNFYEGGERKIQVFDAIIELVIQDDTRINDGVPITITACREAHEERNGSGLFFKDVKPFLILKVNK
jgi:hypothetical protein